MGAPAISLIITAYNAAPFIDRGLSSVLGQTFGDFEVILVDDASTDDTAAILESWQQKLPRCRLIAHGQNEGLAVSRNDAIAAAQGDYIAFADIDDVLAPTMLEALHGMASRTGADVAQVQYMPAYPGKSLPRRSGRQQCRGTDARIMGSHEALAQMLLSDEYTMCTRLYARSLFHPGEATCPPGLTCEDRVANFILLSRANRVAVSDCVEYYYMRNEGSISYGGLTLRGFDLLVADDLVVDMACELGDEEVLQLALDRQAKGAFSLLVKWARFGIADDSLDAERAVAYLTDRFAKDYPRLMRSPMSAAKKAVACQIRLTPQVAYRMLGGKKADDKRACSCTPKGASAGASGESYPYEPGQKLLTVVMPCYNVQDYLERGLNSFADSRFDDTLEVLIVDDGSKDGTAAIAQKYVQEHPRIFKLIRKENGGHGSAVNVGIRQASGLYFRIVDGDDWVSTDGLAEFMGYLGPQSPDILVDEMARVDMRTDAKSPQPFPDYIQTGCVLDFPSICNRQDTESYISIHTMTARTAMLRSHGIEVREGIFYEDYEYVVKATCFAQTVEFVPVEVYNYLVGNAGQSMAAKNMAERYLHHEAVLKELLAFAEQQEFSPQMAQYMARKLQLLVNTHYNVLLIFDAERQRGARRARLFRRWLRKCYPDMARLTERRYRQALALHHLGFDAPRLDKLMGR